MISAVWDFIIRMLPGALLGGLLYVCFLPPRRSKFRQANQISLPRRELALFVFFLFCGGLALITLTPRWFHWLAILNNGQPDAFFQWGTFNLIPFQTFRFDSWHLMILLGNLLLFLPIGFFPALLWRDLSRRRVLLIGISVALLIECVQLFIGRTFDIDDILLNTIGVFLGGLLCRTAQHAFPVLHTFQVQII